MNIFDSLVNAIESARQVVIGSRRALTQERGQAITAGTRALIEMADPALAVTKADREDIETADLCQHQLEELMACLLPQIPD